MTADTYATRCPVARTDDLVVTEAGDDTLVYDLVTHRAHSLDAAAAALWRLCDGTRDIAALAESAREAIGGAADDVATRQDVVRYTLGRLRAAGLLRDTGAAPAERAMSRRALLRRAAETGVATLALPAILSIVAPTTLQAQASCLPGGALCVPGGPRCCAPFNCTPINPGPVTSRVCR